MPGLPTGTVTFLFTDIEGSTRPLPLTCSDVGSSCTGLYRPAPLMTLSSRVKPAAIL